MINDDECQVIIASPMASTSRLYLIASHYELGIPSNKPGSKWDELVDTHLRCDISIQQLQHMSKVSHLSISCTNHLLIYVEAHGLNPSAQQESQASNGVGEGSAPCQEGLLYIPAQQDLWQWPLLVLSQLTFGFFVFWK